MPVIQRVGGRLQRGAVTCPFTIQVDTREQYPYMFSNLRTNKKDGEKLIEVPLEFKSLETGDYSISGNSGKIVVERKSKEDLFGSVTRRDNFEGRLKRMTEIAEAGGYAAIVVESSIAGLSERPVHSKVCVKSLNRTILAWRQRYRADWWFVESRVIAEQYTFRILERFYLDKIQPTATPQS